MKLCCTQMLGKPTQTLLQLGCDVGGRQFLSSELRVQVRKVLGGELCKLPFRATTPVMRVRSTLLLLASVAASVCLAQRDSDESPLQW